MYYRQCKQEKPEEAFAWKVKGVRRQKDCKECHNTLYGRVWYQKNKEKHLVYVRRNQKKATVMRNAYVLEYLRTHPCEMCGESDPVVLEFDHKDSRNKTTHIALLKSSRVAFSKLVDEIKKCRVLCANCHRRKTATERGWYKASNWKVASDENLL